MLNLSNPNQKLNLIINTCLLFATYTTKIPKILHQKKNQRKTKYNKEHQKKNQIQQRSHSRWGLPSHFPLDHCWWYSSEMFSNSVLYLLAENWMRDTVLFVLRNRKLEMLVVETIPTLVLWGKFYWPTYF